MVEYEIMKQGLAGKAKITSVETKRAAEIFGEKTKNPEQLLIVINANVNGWQGRIGTLTKPSSKYVLPGSKLGKFINRYKRPPEAGMTVAVETNAGGYWTLQL